MSTLVRAPWADLKTRFVLVGVVNTAFGYGVFALLLTTLERHVHYLGVLLAAHVIGVLEAFVLHRWLVFRVRGQVWLDLVRFWSVYLVALGVNLVLLPAFVELGGLPVLLAQLIVLLVVAIGSYVGHRSFSFRRRPEPTEAPARPGGA